MKQIKSTAKLVGLSFLILFCGVSLAHATLIGDLVTIESAFPTISDVNSAHAVEVEDGVVEYACPGLGCDGTNDPTLFDGEFIDIRASSILVHLTGNFLPGDFDGFIVSDLHWVDAPDMLPVISSIATDGTFLNFTKDDVVLDGRSVSFNFEGLEVEDFLDVTVTFRDHDNGQAPAPATVALLGVGLVALGLRRRR